MLNSAQFVIFFCQQQNLTYGPNFFGFLFSINFCIPHQLPLDGNSTTHYQQRKNTIAEVSETQTSISCVRNCFLDEQFSKNGKVHSGEVLQRKTGKEAFI